MPSGCCPGHAVPPEMGKGIVGIQSLAGPGKVFRCPGMRYRAAAEADRAAGSVGRPAGGRAPDACRSSGAWSLPPVGNWPGARTGTRRCRISRGACPCGAGLAEAADLPVRRTVT
jgi:hypothetical protein